MGEITHNPETYSRNAQERYLFIKSLYGKAINESRRSELEHELAGICTVLNQQYL